MSSSEDDTQHENPVQQVDIGSRLRETRESKKLTVEVVAAQLKLRSATVIYLEENRYEELPGETFIRGYIRSYANLLELDGSELARSYEPEPVQGKDSFAPIKSIERNNRTRFILVILLLLIMVIAGLGYFWWRDQDQQSTQPVQLERSENAEVQVEGVDGVLHIQSLDQLTAQTALMELEEVRLSKDEPADSAAASSSTEQAAIAEGDELVLNFIDDCWIRITDASGNELASGLKRAGEELTLSGSAPFEIHLGYAQGVFITLNGQQVEFDSSIRGNVARIKLG